MNEMDGFFLPAVTSIPILAKKLEGAEVVVGGGQPKAMFMFACHKAGIDFDKIHAITAAARPPSILPIAGAKGNTSSSRGRSPNSSRPTASGTLSPRWGLKLDPMPFPV